MKKMSLNAVSLRIILSVTLFLIAGILVAVLWFSNDILKKSAAEVSQVTSDAGASQSSVQTLQKIKQELESKKDIIAKASSIVADSQGYKYQDQIIKDLNGYAAASGIVITNFTFTTAAAPAAAAPAAPAAGGATGAAVTPAAPSGVKSTSASISLKSPVKYVNLLQFIHSIEQNLTKMQIARITLSKGTTHDDVSTDALEIQVYIN